MRIQIEVGDRVATETIDSFMAHSLALNLDRAAMEKVGEPIAPPGYPLHDPEGFGFITSDCIAVAEP